MAPPAGEGVEVAEPLEFGLNVRIPGWCKEASLTVAGAETPLELHNGYAHVRRLWNSGESLVLKRSKMEGSLSGQVGTVYNVVTKRKKC